MTRMENFLNGLACSVLLCAVVLVIVLLIASSCSAPELETPVLRNVSVSAPDTMDIRIDGILQGYGSCTVILVENYPNYVEIGPWEFVLFPPCDYDSVAVHRSLDLRE